MGDKAKIYFPGLNGLRFISAMLVVVAHVEFAKLLMGKPNLLSIPFFRYVGELGVTFFFVLSGFLITYLLLAERERTGKISVRKFYVRRILRIWPLYYLVFALAFLLMPGQGATGSAPGMFAGPGEWAYYAFFIPNVAIILFNSFHFAVPLWSIGAEEQYYAFWPWMVRPGKPILWWAIAFVLVFTTLKWVFYGAAESSGGHYLFKFIYASRFDCMAIGAIVAWMLFTRQKQFLGTVFSRAGQFVIWALLIILLLFGVEFSFMTNQVYGLLFALIILNTGANARRLIGFETPLLHYLGKISYGIYMFHSFAIAIVIGLIAALGLAVFSGFIFNLALYTAVSLLTIGIASASYHAYETPFLRLKNRFRRIKLGKKAI